MTTDLSKTQIDKLGNRLKSDELLEPDVQQLDQYRRTFAEPYEHVVGLIRSSLGLEPTGRPAKSTTAIREKLHRESIRLSQIQDIAGCRLVVENIEAQDRTVENLKAQFDDVTVVDRREKSSHGYRAVHLIVRFGGKPIEVQIRTTFQHLWAELSEKLADVVDPAIKYGGGPQGAQDLLAIGSEMISRRERQYVRFAELSLAQGQNISPEMEAEIAAIRATDEQLDADIMNGLTEMIEKLSTKVGT